LGERKCKPAQHTRPHPHARTTPSAYIRTTAPRAFFSSSSSPSSAPSREIAELEFNLFVPLRVRASSTKKKPRLQLQLRHRYCCRMEYSADEEPWLVANAGDVPCDLRPATGPIDYSQADDSKSATANCTPGGQARKMQKLLVPGRQASPSRLTRAWHTMVIALACSLSLASAAVPIAASSGSCEGFQVFHPIQ
jgi:hypothetical protein